jgi:hypothetical protein
VVVGLYETQLDVRNGRKVEDDGEVVLRKVALAHPTLLLFLLLTLDPYTLLIPFQREVIASADFRRIDRSQSNREY